MLACIGSGERLRLLLAILQKPQTVAELVKTCGFGSTGQVYHHMKPLLAADLIREDMPKGTYVLQPHKVQGLLMLLAGICDMVDETYTCAPPHSEPESEAAPGKRGLTAALPARCGKPIFVSPLSFTPNFPAFLPARRRFAASGIILQTDVCHRADT